MPRSLKDSLESAARLGQNILAYTTGRELKDKLDISDSKSPRAPQQDAMNDILHALLALGYSDREAQAAAKSLPPDLGVADGIRMALKSLAKP